MKKNEGRKSCFTVSLINIYCQVIKNTLDPSWPEFELSLATLCNGDKQRSLQFTVWDWNSSGKPDLIGSFLTSVERLEADQLTYQVVSDERLDTSLASLAPL
jgi:Ca2+-dependent lipid-binding protein